jgi:hypothetical protein
MTKEQEEQIAKRMQALIERCRVLYQEHEEAIREYQLLSERLSRDTSAKRRAAAVQ